MPGKKDEAKALTATQAAALANAAETSAASTPTLNEKYSSLVGDNTNTINTMYDASRESQLSSLENSYNQNVSDYEAQRGQIDNQYNSAATNLEQQYQRNRQANNIQAASNGLNTGTGSQMALAQTGQYQSDYGNIRTQQAEAQIEQDRLLSNLRITYENQVRQAIADNDQARAAALLDEYNRQTNQITTLYSMQMDEANNRAALLAAAGDYSGYAELLGITPSQQGVLEAQWAVENPDAAYQAGKIDANKYYAITGDYPEGYVAPSSGSSGSSGGSSWYRETLSGLSDYSGYTNSQKLAYGHAVSNGYQGSIDNYYSK